MENKLDLSNIFKIIKKLGYLAFIPIIFLLISLIITFYL